MGLFELLWPDKDAIQRLHISLAKEDFEIAVSSAQWWPGDKHGMPWGWSKRNLGHWVEVVCI